jgi:hypothetical protein
VFTVTRPFVLPTDIIATAIAKPGLRGALPNLFPVRTRPVGTKPLVEVGDHIVLPPRGLSRDNTTEHGIVVHIDHFDGATVVVMKGDGSGVSYEELTLRQWVGDKEMLPRAVVVKNGEHNPAPVEGIVDRAKSFLPGGALHDALLLVIRVGEVPVPVWDKFAFGFFCQTGYLLPWHRFERWAYDPLQRTSL